jgi:hypothetical protein
MTVKDLIDVLEELDEDMEVVFQGANSGGYVDGFSSEYEEKELRSFYGNDRDVVVLYASSQLGMA